MAISSCEVFPQRSGGRWRDLPERCGNYHTVKKRYYRSVEAGVLEALFEALAADADMDWISVDSTSIRAQSQAAGARRKVGGTVAEGRDSPTTSRPRVLAVRAAA